MWVLEVSLGYATPLLSHLWSITKPFPPSYHTTEADVFLTEVSHVNQKICFHKIKFLSASKVLVALYRFL